MFRFSSRVRDVATGLVFALLASTLQFVLLPSVAQAAVEPGQYSEVDYAASFSDSVFAAPVNSPVIPASDTSFTVDGWFWLNERTARTDSYYTIFAQNQDRSGCIANRVFLAVHWNSTENAYELHSGQNNCGQYYYTGSVPTSQWVHFAYVSNDNEYRTYINGQLVYAFSQSMSVVASNTASFNVGSVALTTTPYTRTHTFSGQIDHLKVWSNALTQEQILTSMNTASAGGLSGLTHMYDFNEGSGSTVYDRVGSVNLSAAGDYTFQDVKKSSVESDGSTVVAFPRSYFPGSGGWRVPDGVESVGLLAVAGGGGGGAWVGGGGGAGGFYESTSYAVTPGQNLPIVVGQGGVGAQYKSTGPIYGNASGKSTKVGSFEVPGGGAGANYNGNSTATASPGGSGGGGTTVNNFDTYYRLGFASAGQAVFAGAYGFPGGTGSDLNPDNPTGVFSTQPHTTGGGGGAGGPGGNAVGADSPTAYSGAGGPGSVSQLISPALATLLGIGQVDAGSVYFAGGGGGGIHGQNSVSLVRAGALGGVGGGGTGNSFNNTYAASATASSGLANTGGGGGGSGNNATALSIGGSGGSGVVVFRIAPNEQIDYAASLSASSSQAYYLPKDGGLGSLSLTNDFTVETWAKLASLPSSGTDANIFTKELSYELAVDSDGYFKYALRLQGQSWDWSPTSISAPVGEWFHVAFIKRSSGDAVTLVLNGVSVFTSGISNISGGTISALANLELNDTTFTIGARDNNSATPSASFFNGEIDEFRVWSTPRSVADISANMHKRVDASSAGLVSYWTFNSGSSATASDLVGNNDLTGFNSPRAKDVKIQVTDANGDLVITFPRTYLPESGGWVAPNGVTEVTALIVGGGGAGGSGYDNGPGGGGGAGGFIETQVALIPQVSIPVLVGMGGEPDRTPINSSRNVSKQAGFNGGVSKFGALEVLGGGGGGGREGSGRAGASGGGAGGRFSASSQGLAADPDFGNDGGDVLVDFSGGGGGGGAGSPGANSSTPASASGGLGAYSSVLLTTVASGGDGGSKGTQNLSGLSGLSGTGRGGNGGSATTGTPDGVGFGGAGGSGVVALRISRSIDVSLENGFRGGSSSISGTVSAPAGTYIMSLDATTGSMTLASLPTGVTANTGISSVGLIALQGDPQALNVALNQISFAYGSTDGDFTLSATLMPAIVDSSNRVQDPETGHIYVTSTSSAAVSFNTFSAYADNQIDSSAKGYLSNITSQRETDFLAAAPSAFQASNMLIGLSDADSNGNWSPTWSWIAGPAKGQVVSYGHVNGNPPKTTISGVFQSWSSDEPNNNSTGNGPNCGVTNFHAAGVWDDIACASGTAVALIEFGGMPTDSSTDIVGFTVEQQFVDVNFTELIFDYSDHTNITSRSSVGNCADSDSDCIGKALNDQVLFNSVSTRDGVTIDALVTTKTLYNAVVKRYEVGASAGGENAHFQADIYMGTSGGGYADFEFKFYLHGTYPNNPVQVRLKNVDVSLIDIDYYQYNNVTDIGGFTVASGTNIKTCMSATAITTCTANTTTTVNNGLFGGTNFTRFQGRSGIGSNDPKDMAIATYGSIESFTVRLGTTQSSKNNNLYGVAFVALPWGSATPLTSGTQYTLNYDGNGNTSGSTASAVTGGVGTKITLPYAGTLARTGYTFGGWNTNAAGTGTQYAAGGSYSMPNGGATLYAVWVPTLYTLTYNANGGSGAPSSGTYGAGTTVTVASGLPTKTGSTFRYWSANSNGSGATYSAGATFAMPASNTTVYAQWEVAMGSLVYYGNGGTTTQPSVSATAGATVNVATGSLTSRSGYTFLGWNTAANGSGTDYGSGSQISIPTGTTSLYAQWSRNVYSITYLANGGSGAPTGATGYAGASYNISSTAPTRTGYTFSGWNTTSTGSGTAYTANQSITLPASNLLLYAQWTANSYTISYDVNTGTAGTEPASQSELAYSNATLSGTVPTKTGFKFNGWNTAANGSGTSYVTGSGLVMPAANVTLYAQWVDNSFDIVYNPNGGSGGPQPSSSSGQATIVVSSNLPTRTGYTFTGWNKAANGSGTSHAAGSSYTVTGDTYFYAQWQAQLFKIYYNVNGGSGAPATESGLIVSQSATVSSTVPTRTGYSFDGWATSTASGASAYAAGNTFQMPAADVTLYAKWTGLPFLLQYNANGGSGAPSNETLNAGSTTLVGSSPTRTGYTFAGWNVSSNGSSTSYSVNGLLTMPGGNLTLYAIWTPVTKSLIFNGNGGSGSPSNVSGTYSSTVTIPATQPTRSGYTFLGWNTNCDGTGTAYQPGDQLQMTAADINLCAQWQAITYQLIYDANGGSNPPAGLTSPASVQVSVSGTLPTRLGYSFGSWNSAANGSGNRYLPADLLTMPAANLTLYAMWTAEPSTIYYNANGGSGAPSAQPGRTGDSTNVSGTVPTRPGYRFINWNTEVFGSGTSYSTSAGITLPPGNVTLYAQWEYLTYTLTYNANGGSGAPAQVSGLTVSETLNLSGTAPTRTGYRFLGWNSMQNGSGQSYATGSAYVMPAANVTLYAKWIGNDYRFAYNPNGGSGEPDPEIHTVGSSVTVSSIAPTRTGYTFKHWATAPNGSGTTYSATATFTLTGDTTLYAIWEVNAITISYDVNGGTGTTPSTQSANFGDSVMLAPSTGLTKTGSLFLGWNTAANGSGTQYSAEQIIFAPPQSMVLYAQWSSVYYVLEYNPVGGSGEPADALATSGQTLTIPSTTPSKSGYEFTQWTNVSGTTTYTPGTTITMPSSNLTLFAVWSTATPTSGGGGLLVVVVPTTSPTVSPTLSPSVSEPVSPTDSPEAPGVDGGKPKPKPSGSINFQDYINAKIEEYDPNTFENWSSSEEVNEDTASENEPSASVTEAPTGIDSAEGQSDSGSPLPWLLGGFGAAVLAALGLVFAGRRRRD